MPRVVLAEGKQQAFLDKVRATLGGQWEDLAQICGVHPRTIRDWRREKHRISPAALERLSLVANVPKPSNMQIVDDYWYVSKGGYFGGQAHVRLYGNPGIYESRRKGGLVFQQKRRENPEAYLNSGVIMRKKIHYPEESEGLAEACGIILGDGNISDHQVQISTNELADREYAEYAASLFKRLFGADVAFGKRERSTLTLVMSGINLVEFLISKGLVKGDKIVQQVDIPEWILGRADFKRGCIRGLIDTGGGIYYHTHTTKGITYTNIGLCFTSYSLPLLKSVYGILLEFGLNAKYDNKRHVSIYGEAGIRSYLERVGTNNPKHLSRFQNWLAS